MPLRKVISGGQTGADQAGLSAAKFHGLFTGGYAPKGYITSEGENTTLKYGYGLQEIEGGYKKRTWMNVAEADATIRLAVDFDSPGEKCTFNAIQHYKKPYFDVPLLQAPIYLIDVVDWIHAKKIEILNVAGNTQGKFGFDIYSLSYSFLFYVFSQFAS